MIGGFLIISCEKEEPELIDSKDKIDYNYTTDSKENVLEISDGDSLVEDQTYTFYANLEENVTLKVRLTNMAENADPNIPFPSWFYSNKVKWDETMLANATQTFVSIGSGVHNADIKVSPAPGKAIMDFYENADTITKTDIFTWY
ncbi:MAG: hypothetical protein R3279_02880 [Putridiphycobacter sp.]|nr:hypothetical protein [Putridiphycobacter sp.]